MERIFGISYPTVKNRLNAIAEQLQFVEAVPRTAESASTSRSHPQSAAVLDSLESGEIDVAEGGAEALLMRLPPSVPESAGPE